MNKQSHVPSFDSLNNQSQIEKLDFIANFHLDMECLSKHVLDAYLQPYKFPHWEWSSEKRLPLGRLGTALHKIYYETYWIIRDYAPTSLWLTLGVLLTLSFELVFPLLIASQVHYSLFASIQTIGNKILLIILYAIAIFLVTYTATGGYWTIYEMARNTLLSRKIRVVICLVAIIFIGFWVSTGSPIYSDSYVPEFNNSATEYYGLVQNSLTYKISISFLLYVPALGHAAYWFTKFIIFMVVMLGSIFKWIFTVNDLNSVQRFGEFLNCEINCEDGLQIRLLDFDYDKLNSLYQWTLFRREIVQSRLLPSTLMLAFLGLVANTSLGELAVQTVINGIRDVLILNQTAASIGAVFASYMKFFLIATVIMIPVGLLVRLFNQAYIMDFLAEACKIALFVHKNASPEIIPIEERKHSGIRAKLFKFLRIE